MVDVIKTSISYFPRLFTSSRVYYDIKYDKTCEVELHIGSKSTHKRLFIIDFSRDQIALIQRIHQL